MQVGLLGYYGRWLLPVPHRVAITVITAVVSAPRTAEPTSEQVEALHREVAKEPVSEQVEALHREIAKEPVQSRRRCTAR